MIYHRASKSIRFLTSRQVTLVSCVYCSGSVIRYSCACKKLPDSDKRQLHIWGSYHTFRTSTCIASQQTYSTFAQQDVLTVEIKCKVLEPKSTSRLWLRGSKPVAIQRSLATKVAQRWQCSTSSLKMVSWTSLCALRK